jgi:hypothetical protein
MALNQATMLLAAVNSITTGEPLAVIHKRNGTLRIVESVCGIKALPDEIIEDISKVTCAHCLDIVSTTRINRDAELRDDWLVARDMVAHPEDYDDVV